ncbi:hypothetical protein MXB_2156 [Myxobolus squamalis]|nr:hypothetical protein MXB_2156 [Myxobolus squamalis]
MLSPSWITESVDQNLLLPWFRYALNMDKSNHLLPDFFSSKPDFLADKCLFRSDMVFKCSDFLKNLEENFNNSNIFHFNEYDRYAFTSCRMRSKQPVFMSKVGFVTLDITDCSIEPLVFSEIIS